jgi:phosphatidylethanolamine-binding protein (PEBP) family uncharacterized protein
MRKKLLSAAVLTAAILALVLATRTPAATTAMTLTSTAFADGGRIPDKYTQIDRTGKNISLPENASANMPNSAVQLNNSTGEPFYFGPYPPQLTGLHPYVITVYALNVASLGLPVNTSLAEFEGALQGKVVSSASITGYFRIGESTTAENMLLLQ